jgi:hypothetical protein
MQRAYELIPRTPTCLVDGIHAQFVMMIDHLWLWSIGLAFHKQPYQHSWVFHILMHLGMGAKMGAKGWFGTLSQPYFERMWGWDSHSQNGDLGVHLSQPYFEKVWGWDPHSRNGDLGVHRDFQNFKIQLQGPNSLHWSILYIIGKLSKCRWKKWARMSHLDICSTSYDNNKKGPLKVGNRLDLGACKSSATHHWKALDKNYKFALDLIPIGGLNKKL